MPRGKGVGVGSGGGRRKGRRAGGRRKRRGGEGHGPLCARVEVGRRVWGAREPEGGIGTPEPRSAYYISETLEGSIEQKNLNQIKTTTTHTHTNFFFRHGKGGKRFLKEEETVSFASTLCLQKRPGLSIRGSGGRGRAKGGLDACIIFFFFFVGTRTTLNLTVGKDPPLGGPFWRSFIFHYVL